MKLQIHDLSKRFGNQIVLEHLSLELEGGRIYGLMAPSGRGKTTFFRILMGLERADGGSITLEETDLDWNKLRISAVFQEDRLCETFSAVDNVLLTADSAMNREAVQKELEELLPREALNRPVYTLSGGQKRRVAICRALCAPFDLLILDEPFTGLDAESKSKVMEYLKKKSAGKLILLSTHQEEDLSSLQGIRISLA